jgi:hypothetical protein
MATPVASHEVPPTVAIILPAGATGVFFESSSEQEINKALSNVADNRSLEIAFIVFGCLWLRLKFKMVSNSLKNQHGEATRNKGWDFTYLPSFLYRKGEAWSVRSGYAII